MLVQGGIQIAWLHWRDQHAVSSRNRAVPFGKKGVCTNKWVFGRIRRFWGWLLLLLLLVVVVVTSCLLLLSSADRIVLPASARLLLVGLLLKGTMIRMLSCCTPTIIFWTKRIYPKTRRLNIARLVDSNVDMALVTPPPFFFWARFFLELNNVKVTLVNTPPQDFFSLYFLYIPFIFLYISFIFLSFSFIFPLYSFHFPLYFHSYSFHFPLYFLHIPFIFLYISFIFPLFSFHFPLYFFHFPVMWLCPSICSLFICGSAPRSVASLQVSGLLVFYLRHVSCWAVLVSCSSSSSSSSSSRQLPRPRRVYYWHPIYNWDLGGPWGTPFPGLFGGHFLNKKW